MKWVAGCLGLLLILSNGFWGYVVLDISVSKHYLNDSYITYERLSLQLMNMLPDLSGSLKKEEILKIAEKHSDLELGFLEKEGCSFVGRVGFKFDHQEKLIAAVSRADLPVNVC